MRTVNRTELLALLQSVSHGLSARDQVEQSSCFVFKKGELMTFNDEVACRVQTKMKVNGAVSARALMAILDKLPDDELQVSTTDSELILRGKRRETAIRMEADIHLPMEHVEKPKKFMKLHKDFTDAIEIAQDCTGKNEDKFWTTCVHIHPKWVEACDSIQVVRYKLHTGIDEGTLVKSKFIKCIIGLDMTKFALTPTWIHFKNRQGLVLSCRRYIEDYPIKDLTRILKVTGTPTHLPKGLVEATERADVFSSENTDVNLVQVELRSGRLKVRGDGVSGYHVESKKLKYKGKALDFLIAPKLLGQLTRRHNECELTEDRIKVDGGKFIYVSCLSKVGETDVEEEPKDEEDQDGEGDGSGSEEGEE